MATESESVETMESMDVDEVDGKSTHNFQSVNKLIEYLPYSATIGAEAEFFHHRLKENLSKAVGSHNVQLGTSACTKSFQSYMHQFGYRFTKEQHITYIKLYYELLTMKECPLNLVSTFAGTVNQLLRKPHLLTRDDIIIPWRPLFETLDRCVFHRKYTLSSASSKALESNIKSVIINCNKYFDGNTLAEVMEAFKPLMCPSTCKMTHSLDMLKLFLPYFNPDTIPQFQEFLEFLLEIYNSWNNSAAWEWSMVSVLGNASYYMVGKFDWDPYLPLMYSRLMKGLCLPVYFKGIQNTPLEQSAKAFDASSAARWIIGTLGNRSQAIKNLKNFLETVETYYNPLNMGRWSGPLASLLNELVSIFTLRLKRERYSKEGRYWWLSTPADRYLTDSDIDEFVKMTSELVLDFYIDVTTGGFILKNLACIRPQLIIPAVMEKYESMVETVTEPKKYLITMRWMTIILLPLVSVRQEEDGFDGRNLVIPFALSLLPTITCNDMQKTLSSLGVIHGLFNLIPFVDCSNLSASLEDENERNLCQETSCLEDFSLQFLDTILNLVESKAHENTRMTDHRGSTNAVINLEDLGLEKLLWAVSHRLAVQSSTKIFRTLAKKVVGFALSKILEPDVSGRLFASMLQAFAAARPDIVLPKLIPKLCVSIETHVTDDILDDSDLDKYLLFHLLILSYVVETTGVELLKFKTELESVLVPLLKLNGKKPYTFVSNLLQRLLNSLIYIYPLENRISEADFDASNYLAIKDWGLTMDKKDVHINWHVPRLEEVEWAKEIFLRVFNQFAAKYDGIENLQQKDEKINKSILKDLHVLIAILDGLQPLLSFWDNEPIQAFADSQLDFSASEYDFGLPNVDVTIPGTGQNIKQKYFGIFCGIKTYLDRFKNDDTEAYIQLIKGMDNLIFINTEPDRRMSVPAAKNLRSNLQNVLNPKRKSTRGTFVARVFEFHLKRLRLSVTRTWSVSHMKIMEKMFELCTNSYARVRVTAQSRFCRMVDSVSSVITSVISPMFIEKLRAGVPHDEYKGTLYTMLSCKYSPLLNNSWPQLCSLWIALLKSPFSEKNSIIKCMESVRKQLSQSFMFFPLQDQVSAKAVEFAQRLSSLTPEEWNTSLVKLDTSVNHVAFHKMISELIAASDNGLNHWRQRVLCIHMLSVMIVEDIPMPQNMVEYFYDSLVSNAIDVRTTALHTIAWFSAMYKRRLDTIEVDTRTGLKFAEGESVHSVLQYKSNPEDEGIKCRKLAVTSVDGRSLSKFHVHKLHYGYTALPSTLVVKLPPADYSDFTSQPEPIRVTLEVAQRYFNNPEYVKKLIDIFSEDEKGRKSSGNKRTRLFIAIARNNGPGSLNLIMKNITPLAKDKDQWKQRCAADIVSAILYGMKLWDDKQIAKFWIELRPILNDCLDSVTQETLSYWSESMTIPTSNRDPNMMRFFIELMKERWTSSLQTVETTSVNAFKNMNFFDNTVANLHWRGAELYHETFEIVQKYFTDTPIPYVNCRDQLGRLIGDIFEWAGDQPVRFDNEVSPRFEPFVNLLFDTLKDLVSEASKYMANEKDTESNAAVRKLLLRFKSVLELVISLCWDSETSVNPVLYRFIPLCCHFESYDADPELKSLSGVTLSGFSRILILPKYIDLVLDQVETAATSTSWKSRLCVVEFLKVFALNNTNIFASSAAFSNRIMALVLLLLSDRKIEVRECASNLLSGFLHSLILQNPMELLESFQRQARSFSRKLQVVWKKTPRTTLTTEEIDAGHSAILGLCAFVDTYPYDVPEFLPNVLVTLSTHLHDPQPIPMTLRKTLSNFRRTHHDNWAVHKTKFSEDQLCILTDIFVSPCYYA